MKVWRLAAVSVAAVAGDEDDDSDDVGGSDDDVVAVVRIVGRVTGIALTFQSQRCASYKWQLYIATYK